MKTIFNHQGVFWGVSADKNKIPGCDLLINFSTGSFDALAQSIYSICPSYPSLVLPMSDQENLMYTTLFEAIKRAKNVKSLCIYGLKEDTDVIISILRHYRPNVKMSSEFTTEQLHLIEKVKREIKEE